LLLLLLLLLAMIPTAGLFVIVSVMSSYVMGTVLLQHLLSRRLFVFTHSSDREIQGLFFMWRVMMKGCGLMQ
jgi:hypothetical protein